MWHSQQQTIPSPPSIYLFLSLFQPMTGTPLTLSF
jgi:hypothetical protein